MARKLAKRACQRCEYINPRQALYCLRCGDIFRPVVADTPYEFLKPEREQRRARALGKAALETIPQAGTESRWLRVLFNSMLLLGGCWGMYRLSGEQVFGRMLASEPSVVTHAIWEVHRPAADRSKKPLIRPQAVLRTIQDPLIPAWFVCVGPVAVYLLGLGLFGLVRREVGPARMLSLIDPVYPIGAFWNRLMKGGRNRPSARLKGAPAVLVAAVYTLWGMALILLVPAAIYTAELRMEGWEKGLKALGLEAPPLSKVARKGLWAARDGTLRLLIESGLEPAKAVDFYHRRYDEVHAVHRLEGTVLSAVHPAGGRFYAVAHGTSPRQARRGFRSVLYLSLSPPRNRPGFPPPAVEKPAEGSAASARSEPSAKKD